MQQFLFKHQQNVFLSVCFHVLSCFCVALIRRSCIEFFVMIIASILTVAAYSSRLLLIVQN